jgi:two-component system, OmpR family, response regulator
LPHPGAAPLVAAAASATADKGPLNHPGTKSCIADALKAGSSMNIPPLTRILCVDDEPLVRALARAALETRGGFTLLICGSGSEALQAAAGFAPDLMLLDVMMPDMDGAATLAALRLLPATADTPAAFMTTKAQAQMLAGRNAAGVIGIIDKPFDPMTLADRLRALWARSHGES